MRVTFKHTWKSNAERLKNLDIYPVSVDGVEVGYIKKRFSGAFSFSIFAGTLNFDSGDSNLIFTELDSAKKACRAWLKDNYKL